MPNNWKNLSALLGYDPDEEKLKQQALLSQTPLITQPILDPLLLEALATKAGYRDELGLHPDLIKGALGLQLRLEQDKPIVK